MSVPKRFITFQRRGGDKYKTGFFTKRSQFKKRLQEIKSNPANIKIKIHKIHIDLD